MPARKPAQEIRTKEAAGIADGIADGVSRAIWDGWSTADRALVGQVVLVVCAIAAEGTDRASACRFAVALSDVLVGPVFEPIVNNDDLFRRVAVDYGTLVCPGDVDIAPETIIWDGPYPPDEATRRPEPHLRPRRPQGRESIVIAAFERTIRTS